MNETLKALYDSFYTPPEKAELQQEIDDAHRQLVDRLDKPERRLLLKIIDESGHIADELSLDSFIYGFQLAWQLASELNSYQSERPAPEDRSSLGARSTSRGEASE